MDKTLYINAELGCFTLERDIRGTTTAKEDLIIKTVLKEYNRPRTQVFSRSQKIDDIIPRHIIAYLMKKVLNYNEYRIASILHRERTTIIHSLRVVEDMMFCDVNFKNNIQSVIEKLRNKIEVY